MTIHNRMKRLEWTDISKLLTNKAYDVYMKLDECSIHSVGNKYVANVMGDCRVFDNAEELSEYLEYFEQVLNDFESVKS